MIGQQRKLLSRGHVSDVKIRHIFCSIEHHIFDVFRSAVTVGFRVTSGELDADYNIRQKRPHNLQQNQHNRVFP